MNDRIDEYEYDQDSFTYEDHNSWNEADVAMLFNSKSQNRQIRRRQMNKHRILAIVTAVLTLVLIVIGLSAQISLIKQVPALEEEVDSLERSQLVEIEEDYLVELEAQKAITDFYKARVAELEETVKSLESKETSEEVEETENSTEVVLQDYNYMQNTWQDSGFRSYLPYNCITVVESDQYKIVSKATPDENGLMMIDNTPLVAVGTGWNLEVGDTATVTTENGSFNVIVGDIKSDLHTDWSRKITTANGCVVEFIVDLSVMPDYIRTSGNVATIEYYSGKVISIVETGGKYI